MRRPAILVASAIAAFCTTPALAQNAGDFQRPWGTSPAQTNQPYRAGTRDANGNRVVVNGVLQTGVGVQAQMNGVGAVGNAPTNSTNTGQTGMASSGHNSSALAVGNQLNVVVSGNYNTVIVNSTQTNNGNVTAVSNAGGGEDDENGN
ncbi:holdfast anchoring protein HfaA [Hyphobacterium sp.]|uniref:holdfast anchoring protein HfaA n=1 Tax=Hyphobacterium sp. TaxID=2004662 RepID=UPI003BAA25EE